MLAAQSADLYRFGIGQDRKGFLFRTAEGRTSRLTNKPMSQVEVYRDPAPAAAGVTFKISCRSWRARGITTSLECDGLLENTQRMTAHSGFKKHKLYEQGAEQ